MHLARSKLFCYGRMKKDQNKSVCVMGNSPCRLRKSSEELRSTRNAKTYLVARGDAFAVLSIMGWTKKKTKKEVVGPQNKNNKVTFNKLQEKWHTVDTRRGWDCEKKVSPQNSSCLNYIWFPLCLYVTQLCGVKSIFELVIGSLPYTGFFFV